MIESGKNILTLREPRMNRDQLELAQKEKQPGPRSHTLLLNPADVPVKPPRHRHLGSTKWTGVVCNKIPSGHQAVGLQPQNMIIMQQWLFRLPCPESTRRTQIWLALTRRRERLNQTSVWERASESATRESTVHTLLCSHPSNYPEIQTSWLHSET